MIPISGKPLLQWHIEQFKKYGVKEFFLTLHYLPDVIMQYFSDGSRWGVKIHYAIEEKPLGSAGGLKLFEGKLKDAFFFIYGDIFSVLDYSKMAKNYEQKNNPVGMQRMKRTDDYTDADVAELDANGKFIAIHKKPHTEKYPNAWRMRGIFILNKKLLSYMPAKITFDLAKDLLPKAIADGENFYSYECDDYSKGIDAIEKWKEVEAKVRELMEV